MGGIQPRNYAGMHACILHISMNEQTAFLVPCPSKAFLRLDSRQMDLSGEETHEYRMHVYT